MTSWRSRATPPNVELDKLLGTIPGALSRAESLTRLSPSWHPEKKDGGGGVSSASHLYAVLLQILEETVTSVDVKIFATHGDGEVGKIADREKDRVT